MRLETRLQRLETHADVNDAPRCTHVISITRDGAAVPESRCDCGREHIAVVVRREARAPNEPRVTT
jgi:hypothetical protein